MKILTILTMAAIVVSINTAGQAETCIDGSLQTGENGHVYCLANKSMNWWSAYSWCEAQGRHLASMYEVCPTWDGGGSNCNLSTFVGTVAMWSATPFEADKVFTHDNTHVYNNQRRNQPNRVLCY